MKDLAYGEAGIPSVADPLIDCATASFAINHAQVTELIGSLCMIVGLAPRVGWYGKSLKRTYLWYLLKRNSDD